MSDAAPRPMQLGLVARLARRRGARFAFVLLALLVSSAVYAPFLANDQPLHARLCDVGAYESALATLAPVTAAWREKLGVDAAGAARESEGVLLRLATLERYSSDSATTSRLRDLLAQADAAAHSGLGARAREIGAEALDRAQASARDQRARRGAEPLAGTVELRFVSAWPALAALDFLDWLAAIGWTVALALLACRAGGAALLGGALASLVLAALAGAAFAPPRVLASASIKAALASGEVALESALFAPLPYGYAETNLSETLRPPTWSAAAEMDAQGRYVRGPRAPRADAATGFVPTSTPVEVRPREPGVNSPLRHLLGTDSLGRDVLARILWGGRVSLTVGFASVALVVLLGVLIGGLAGYFRGLVDSALSGLVGVLQSFPAFFLILVAIALLPTRGVHPQLATIAVIGLVGWTGVARLVRAECLRIVELDYVRAARALGYSHARILARHVLPNALAPVIVAAAFGVAAAILTESAASFLGFGVQPPTPSWGAVMRESRASEHWWILVFPGLALFATVLACTWLGDALRDALDPREEA